MIGNLFSTLAMKVSGGIILALLVALGLTMWRADAISDNRDDLRDQLALANASHAVTTASLDALQAELTAMVRAGEVRAERVAEAREEARESGDLLRAEAAAIAGAARGAGDPCVTPESIINAKGL